MFHWLRNRRRVQWLAEPFPPHWEVLLHRNVAHYAHLTAVQRAKLRDDLRVFLHEKRFEGGSGFVVTEEVRVTVAAQAALLILGLDIDFYRRVEAVIVYATTFKTPDPEDLSEDDDLSDTPLAGQAVYRGPVILSWDAVQAEGRDVGTGQNVVLHEFAHQLDFLDNAIDGTPPIDDPKLEARWPAVMQAAFDRHTKAIKRGKETFFSEHAADNETEYFADATEAFFCAPHDLIVEEPEVYDLLAGFYKVNPREWFPEA